MERFFILCRAHGAHDYALWWRPNSNGYTRSLDQAGLYSRAEAEAIARNRGEDFMVPEDEARRAAHKAVWSDDVAKWALHPIVTRDPPPPPAPPACQEAWADECEGEVCKACLFCPVHAYEANRQGEGACGSCRERPPALGPYDLAGSSFGSDP